MKTETIRLVEEIFSIIVREVEQICNFINDIKYNDFIKNNEKEYAVAKAVEIIGEAAKRLPMSLRQRTPNIPWKKMAGMRDVLVHKFDKIDSSIVWDVAKNHLPKLRDKIMRYKPMIEVLVDLPSSWKVKGLSDVADIYMGQSPPSSSYNESGEGVPFLQGKAEFGEVFPRNTKWTTEPKRISTPWSILISVRAPVGNVNISDHAYAIGRGLAEIRPSNTDVWYLFFALLYERVRLRSEASGTVFQSINKKTLQEFLILYPPLPEQRAIAHVLRAAQRAKEATEGVIAALRELKKSLMRHLFTYGPAPVGDTDGVELQDTEIGPLPAHWKVVRLGEVFDIQQGKALSRKKDKGIRPRPFLRTANISWGHVNMSNLDHMDFTEDEERKFRLRAGDLLVCEGGDVGRTAIWEGQLENVYYQNHIHRLRAKTPQVEPRFFAYWMHTAIKIFNLYLGTSNKTTIPNLSQSRLASFLIPLPPLPEQREIARILQTIDRKIEAEERRKAALEALFKTLLHELMTARWRLPAGFIELFEGERPDTEEAG